MPRNEVTSESRRRRPRALDWLRRVTLVIGVCAGVVFAGAARPSSANDSWQWFKADFHVHSVVSADAFPDLGIIGNSAKTNGFNALFLTDHNLASNFPISQMTANHMFFDDTYRRWTAATMGSLSSNTNELASAPVASGTSSLHLVAGSDTAGESFVWTKRGPNLRAGTSDAILRFAVYPKRLDRGSGIYVSAAIGGDPTVKSPANNPVGYTTTDGVISPGKSTVFIFYFGAPPPESFYGSARVVSYNLDDGYCDRAFALDTWVSCTINVRSKLADLTPTDLPLAQNALSNLKIAVVAQGGTADAYFDAYAINAVSSSAEEFVDRNAIIGSYDTSTFRMFPAVEMGIGEHANRFDFGIRDPAQFSSYQKGVDGIRPTQEGGYPVQLNHPGVDGGVSDAAAINTDAYGADLLEVRQPNMIKDWDAILRKGVPLVGTWGGDNHNGRWTLNSQATFLAAPALTFDDLMQSIFEGRAYMGQVRFDGGFVLNVDDGSHEPYPARYPLYISPYRATVPVHAAIGGGLRDGDTVKWRANDGSASTTSLLATDATAGPAYDANKAVPLGGQNAYVRAEVWSSTGVLRALTQPILFKDVAGLPADLSFHVKRVTTPNGRGYTRIATRGITGTSWDAATSTLNVDLNDPAGSLVELRGTSSSPPTNVIVDGLAAASATTLDEFDAADATNWYHDAQSGDLYLKVLHTAAAASVKVTFATTEPPTVPPPTLPPPPPPGPETAALAPTADSYVSSASTTMNDGRASVLYVDADPARRSYLRFDLGSVAGTVTSATLRVWANSSHSVGYSVFGVDDNGWEESTINWENQPASWGLVPVGVSGPVLAGAWTSVDVTALVAAAAGKPLTLGLSTPSTTNLSLASRESAQPPSLVVSTTN